MMQTKTNTFGVIFYLRRYKAKKGKSPIYARITVDGKRAELSIKQSIEESHWNNGKGLAKGNSDEIKSLNVYLEQVRAKLVQHYQNMILQDKLVNAEAIKNKFLGYDQREYTLCKLVEYHNTEMKHSLAWGTMKNYFTTQKYLTRFLKMKCKTSDVFLTQINYRFITQFEFFLRNWKPLDHHKPLKNNGIMKHMERFRKMINLAIRLEWMKHDPFSQYKPKFDKIERGFLSEDELRLIENKSFKIERLRQVRDLFVFSCYTGLAYIDVINLTTDNLIRGIDGGLWITTSRQKTNNVVQVPLLQQAMNIIETYKEHPKVLQTGSLLPRMSNQKLNSYLKEIADLCGVEKNLTFHLARHTFATTVTLSNGVPIESVSKMLGHSRITTTQVYAKVIEKKVSEDMDALRKKLTKK
ncbi:site-specific integrase [Fulvivirga ligni]|uniref:site-specific integrase n=1 Tax=Fulvivirga ligni TaxID=2904246 RepID=UPI001F3B2A88|nr:site-specific integrase [Fulvivirga ligni]UII20785.1 site-specific integrase [Fulvivirga ligni]